jgi:hypothetical protein
MEILGHSQISLTMNTYGHVLPETQREATTKVADLFGKSRQMLEATPDEPESNPVGIEEAASEGETTSEGEAEDDSPAAENTDDRQGKN